MTTRRHAKPTAVALANRTYRKVIAVEHGFADLRQRLTVLEIQGEQTRSGQRMLSERIESYRVIVEHCARLLREKETVQRQLVEANEFMAELTRGSASPPPVLRDAISEPKRVQATLVKPVACGFAATHIAGVKCFVCGETP